jgi:aminoglycoside phosphotransferase (APT) family kinase protein
MGHSWLDAIPENLHDAAMEAVSSAFGHTPVSAIDPVLGGWSGAVAYRVEVSGRFYLMRMEIRRGPLRNPHQYPCMRIAAGAGLAPPVHYANDDTGAAIMDFVMQRPLHEYPGGPLALAKALGELVAKLQATAPFPDLGDYRGFLERMLAYLRSVFAERLLDPHLEAFEHIRKAYAWDAESHVSSDNDPNQYNILFDGQRLWLIDWETAYRNDPLVDVAILVEKSCANPGIRGCARAVLARQGADPGDSSTATVDVADDTVVLCGSLNDVHRQTSRSYNGPCRANTR